MEDTVKHILDLYGEGVSINDIACETQLSEDEVLKKLKDYRKSKKIKGRYDDSIMKLIARRDCRGVMRRQIMEELGISRSLLAKSVAKFGFTKSIKESDSEELYGVVPDDFEFHQCPECESKRFNEISTIHGALSVDGIYCLKCGGEFFTYNKELYKVKWENID